MPDLASVVRPALEGALEPGETLEGICAGAEQSTFKGLEAPAAWFERFARPE
jgi:hypothetical protein